MTIASTTPRIQYTASGGQTIFAYPYRIFETTDLKVYQTASGSTPDDATDLLTITTHYTVSGAGDLGGGNVTLVTGATAGDTITIVRDVPEERTTDFVDGGDLLADTIDEQMDRFLAMVQEASSRLDRSLSLSNATADGVSVVLPAPVAGYLVGWNDDATALASLAGTDTLVVVQASAPDEAVYKLWYDTATLNFKYWDGATWQPTSGTDITGKQDRDTDAVTGNLAEFDANGHTVDAGVALADVTSGQHTIWIPAGAMVPVTTNGATASLAESATNAVMRYSFDFNTATEEFTQFAVQMPKSWNLGTIVAQAVWSHETTTTNFGVTWGIEAVALANDDALDTVWGTEVTWSDTGGTADDVYISPESGAITVGNTPGVEELVLFRVTRVVGDAGDNLAVDARLHGLKIHYTTNAATDD